MGYGSRTYQGDAVEAVFDTYESGTDSALAVLPTGTGKTVLMAMIAERFEVETGRRVLVVAQRKTLVNQAFSKLSAYGLECSVEMASQDALACDTLFGKSKVVIGSVATLQGARLSRWSPDEFGLIMVDEAHHVLAKSYDHILDHFRDRYLLGLTATPDRGDKRSLGKRFKSKCFDYSLTTAIKGDIHRGGIDPGGWLVPPKRVKCMVSIDLKGIRTTGGDYNIGDLEERIGPHINKLAFEIHENAGNRQTVIFTPDCGSAQAFADLFTKKFDKRCEYVAGTAGKYGMPEAERDAKMQSFEAGEFQYLVNCELLYEGWDCPAVKCVANLRPTKIRLRYAQMVGRGLRPCEETGFFDCLVLDFDWQTEDGRDLTSIIDIFDDGDMDEEVKARARDRERAPGNEHKDPVELIEEAEEYVRIKTKLNIKVTENSERCKTMVIDPIGVAGMLDIPFKKKHDMDSRGLNPASHAQMEYMKSFGVDQPAGVSKWGASKMIKALKQRQEAGLATPMQVRQMLSQGVDPMLAKNLSANSARISLAELAKINGKPEQGILF